MSESTAGFTVSAEMGSMALSGAVLARILTRGRLVTAALLGLLLAIAASFISLHVTSVLAITLARVLQGVGAGAVMMVSFVAVSRFSNPDELFARVNLANLVFGVILVGSMPLLRSVYPGATPLHGMLIALIALLLPTACLPHSMRFLPRETSTQTALATVTVSSGRNGSRLLCVALLCGIALSAGIVSGVIYAASALIGMRLGMSASAIDSAIAVGLFFAIPTSIVAALIGTRYGRVLPMVAAFVTIGVDFLLLSFYPSPLTFRIASCVNGAGLYFALPFLFGAGAAVDATGKDAAYVGSTFTFAGAVSPFVGGTVLEYLGIRAVAPVACIALALSIAAIVYVEKRIVHMPAS